ncbi:helix-turn-helix domain-containing protein [Clostridium vincentii]|uniref:Helix-turn-helix protein n=1 Tax=Clostridium vincentii TaxID=52704 RepID=A0A2T0BDX3_9CLOT|nr:helix-turn-helix transcriptional regulator [Clostridium vincentii]PRR82022.1 helix-turn-helix protein [Clostridium vincentii]
MPIFPELIELIKLARGTRSLTKFAKTCGISPGNLSKILNNENSQIPTPATLKKIAHNAQNNITLEQLMVAADYIPINQFDKKEFEENLTTTDKISLDQRMDEIKSELENNPSAFIFNDGSELSPAAVDSFLTAIEFALGVAKLTNKKRNTKK